MPEKIRKKSIATAIIGANSVYKDYEREENDYFATDPIAAKLLLEIEPELNNIWECACGGGHLAKEFSNAGKLRIASDLVNRGYGDYDGINFLGNDSSLEWFVEQNHLLDEDEFFDIVTNPPYKYAKEFAEKGLELVKEGRKVCLFLKLTFLEGKGRAKFFSENPPKRIWVSRSRIKCAINGDFEGVGSSALAYAWYVWEKGFKGEPTIKWFN